MISELQATKNIPECIEWDVDVDNEVWKPGACDTYRQQFAGWCGFVENKEGALSKG
jgi:hypothetical protein